ncbi:hypothetical protein LIER_17882 [Lithospermum erythrorhizon]|uniref:Uncharacterized protein n=1 Tax=Lithospermum erythrorhizon TaxID=34254 RepID=A0AAV3QHI7_LITER
MKIVSPGPCVKATLHLGSETYDVQAHKGILSEQLADMKEQSMSILKGFITKHNVLNDVPDEPDEISSEDDIDAPPEKSPKKTKIEK